MDNWNETQITLVCIAGPTEEEGSYEFLNGRFVLPITSSLGRVTSLSLAGALAGASL